MDLNYRVKVGTSLKLWESKGWINKIGPYGCFQWYFRYWKRRSKDDKRQTNRWKRIVNRFIGILKNKEIKKNRQILLHCCYKIKKFLFIIKMSYYKKNREILLKKAYNKYHNLGGKEKAAKYYQENKEELKKKERNKYKNMSEDEKNVIRERSKNRYHENKRKLEEIMSKIYRKEILFKYNK